LPDILIFGGTFDPVHNGHIEVAINIQNHCHFDRFIFLPCKVPVLKNNSHASTEQRLDMLHLALQHYPGYKFEVDEREIVRDSPSYMVTTLDDYRLELGYYIAITLLMGSDSFAELPRWYHWEKLLLLCNLLVIDRPGQIKFSDTMLNLLTKHETANPSDLKTQAHGKIYRFNAGLYDYSSTSIRHQLSTNQTNQLPVPGSVAQYIKQFNLYTKK
jgi:nicotinate-nucleotide adenylyltransferase